MQSGCDSVNLTRSDSVPVQGGAEAGASLSRDADPVPFPAAQGGDVTGRAVGGAGQVVRVVEALGRGVVGQDATAGGPGHQGRVGAAVQKLLLVPGESVRTGTWRETKSDSI